MLPVSEFIVTSLRAVTERITLARQSVGFTKVQLANNVNISTVALSALEKGQSEPKLSTLLGIAASTNKPVPWFLGIGGEDPDAVRNQIMCSISSLEATLEALYALRRELGICSSYAEQIEEIKKGMKWVPPAEQAGVGDPFYKLLYNVSSTVYAVDIGLTEIWTDPKQIEAMRAIHEKACKGRQAKIERIFVVDRSEVAATRSIMRELSECGADTKLILREDAAPVFANYHLDLTDYAIFEIEGWTYVAILTKDGEIAKVSSVQIGNELEGIHRDLWLMDAALSYNDSVCHLPPRSAPPDSSYGPCPESEGVRSPGLQGAATRMW